MDNIVQAEQLTEEQIKVQEHNSNTDSGPQRIPLKKGEFKTDGFIPEEIPANEAEPEAISRRLAAEKKISSNVMSILLTSDGLVIKDEDRDENQEELASRLAGVYCEGVQYYDLNGIQYINNTGMAILIDLLKALLEMGVEVQFVNVHESIKKKIKELGLEKIINYGEK